MLNPFVVNCKTDKYDVYVGRPSKWGNPYSHIYGTAKYQVDSREEAVEKFKEFIYSNQELMQLAKKELKNKRLGCVCYPQTPCHAEVLAEIANS